MDLDTIKALIDLVGSSALVELEWRSGATELRLVRAARGPDASAGVPAGPPARTPTAPDLPPPDDAIPAPMMGTFYRRPSPNDPPFVEIGAQVRSGDALGLIEAMKVLNTLTAPRAGTVRAILAEDGAMVEEDQPLFVID